MTTNTTTRKIPAPLYAAAGAGDLAYQKLRKLPDQVSQLRGRVSELAPVVSDVVSETNLRADLDRLRHVARRNAATLVAGAQLATERAAAVYTELVVRGERVVRNVRAEASLEIAPADGTVTVSTSDSTTAKPAAKATKSTAKKGTSAQK
jgi:hypothetical protein